MVIDGIALTGHIVKRMRRGILGERSTRYFVRCGVLERTSDGCFGLTAKGRELLNKYDDFFRKKSSLRRRVWAWLLKAGVRWSQKGDGEYSKLVGEGILEGVTVSAQCAFRVGTGELTMVKLSFDFMGSRVVTRKYYSKEYFDRFKKAYSEACVAQTLSLS